MSHHQKGSAKKKSETRLPPEEDPEFQIAPMIDILLVLLVFFMSISSTEVLQTNENVKLPVAKDAKDKGQQKPGSGQVIVNVLWSEINNGGTYDIDGTTYPSAVDVATKLAAKMSATPDFRVLIRADKSVRYDFLRELLKAAGGVGVSNVTFSVVDKEAGGAK